MRYILLPFNVLWYLILLLPAVPLTIFCIVFAPVICLFIDKDGYLPNWLKWFEPVDTIHGCYDTLWAQRVDHVGWTLYHLCWTFIQRNPAYGACAGFLSNHGKNTVILGNPNTSDTGGIAGWYLYIADNGAFQFSAVYQPLSVGGLLMLAALSAAIGYPLYYFFGQLGLYGLILPILFWVYVHTQGSCVQHGSGWQIKPPDHPTFGSYELNPIRTYSFGA